MSLLDAVRGSVGLVLAVLQVCCCRCGWQDHLGIDVTKILIKAVGIDGVSLASTNPDRQSAAFL